MSKVRGRKPRTHFLLTAAGRVVRVEHDPSADNRLMVPTEHELKAILYDQAGARDKAHENRRESIDYVALHAQRRPRNDGSENQIPEGAGDAGISIGRRVCEPGRSHIRRQKADDTFHSGAHHTTEIPLDEESQEDEDVSSFLDSFSAFGTAKKTPSWASHGQAREAETVVFDHAQATLAMSEPLAQVDLYSILARAPPAELGSKAPGHSDGAGKRGPITLPKKADKQNRERGSSRNVGGIGWKREQRTIQTVPPTLPRGRAGGYLVRDPLGDEVAELDAKVQENLRRTRRDAEREKSTPTIDIGRLYAAIYAERTKPPQQPTRKSVNENDIAGSKDMDAQLSAAAAAAAAAAVVTGGGDEGVTPRLNQRSPTVGRTNRRRSHSNNRREDRRKKNNEDHDLQASKRRGLGASLRKQNNLGDEDHQHWARRKESEDNSEGRAAASRASERYTAEEETWVTRTEGEPAEVVADGGWVRCGKDGTESEARVDEGVQPGWVEGGSNSTGSEERQQQQQLPDDCGDAKIPRADDSDSATASFESTSGMTGKSDHTLPAGRSSISVDHGSILGGITKNIGWREETSSSTRADFGGEGFPEQSVAAAIRIETCWRGFHARCTAKCALRSVLLNALRKFGGGKISKVLALTDIEREEKRGLNRALRVATLSRHQLPPQAHIAACVRFVEALQRRRTRIVETRKRRWVAERRRRKERKWDAHNTPHVPV